MNEVWKDIKGYEGLYQISNFGNVKSLNYKRTGKSHNLTPSISSHGYYDVRLCKNGKGKTTLVHKLVAEHFLGKHKGLTVNHINGECLDNRLENLEIVTQRENFNKGKLAKKYNKINNEYKLKNKNVIMGYFEKQVAEVVEKVIKEKKYNAYDLSSRGINNVTLDALLQRKSKKGKTYGLSTLYKCCLALGIKEIKLDLSEKVEKRKEALSKLSKEELEVLGISN